MSQDLNNNQLPFRPLDNSMTTQTKYELEAKHWYNAQKSVAARDYSSGLGFFSFIGGLLSLIFGLFSFIINLFNLVTLVVTDWYKNWQAERQHDLEHTRYLKKLDALIDKNGPVKGHDTSDEEYLED